MSRRIVHAAALLLLLGLLSPAPAQAQAQDLSPRIGIGLNSLLSTEDGLGIGARVRGSAPLNQDISIAVDMGVSSFIFRGAENAVTIFDPQISGIVSLPFEVASLPYPYLITGVGGHVPITNIDRSLSGPTVHFGIGSVQPLQDSSLFYELNPALLIGPDAVDILIPIRIGIIFN